MSKTMTALSGILAIVLILGIAACASMRKHSRADDFKEVSRSYHLTLMESDFEAAARFMAEPDPEFTKSAMNKLSHFKVADYTPKHITFSEDSTRAVQAVELSYYSIDTMIQRTIVDRQQWRYDVDRKRWAIVSGLPQLK